MFGSLLRKLGKSRTPTVLQMEATECGAACLGIVLAHHGRWVPLEKLREDCGVSRDGSSAGNVARAAQLYGLEVEAFSAEPDSIDELPLPMIVHWNFNHFVVVDSTDKDQVLINDPATGPRSVSHREFDEAFTGVCLTFAPTPEFQRGGEKGGVIRSLREQLPGMKPAVAYIFFLGLLLVVPSVLTPIYLKTFVDEVLIKQHQDWLLWLIGAVLVTSLVTTLLSALRKYALIKLSMRIRVVVASRFLWHVLRLPVRFFDARLAGDIANRFAIPDTLSGVAAGKIAETILNLTLAFFFGALLIYYNLRLAGIVFFFSALNLLALKLFGRQRVDRASRMQQEAAKLSGVSVGGLQLIETIKATGSETDFFSRWAGHYARSISSQQAFLEGNLIFDNIPPALATLSRYLVLIAGALEVMDGTLTLGSLVAFQVLAVSFLEPIQGLTAFAAQLQTLNADVSRLNDVMRCEEDPQLETASETSSDQVRVTGNLVLHDVSFGYSKLEAPLLKSFNLILNPGYRVAIVGGSGSGKSTLAKLVSGLYEPWEGEITLGGVARKEISFALLKRSLAMVNQDITLFEGTVRDNIASWDANLPDHVVVQAAKDACIHDDIMSRIGGYESRVEEGGRNFSGGQRQRLEIARALAASPAILVLDEATSALDPLTEKMIDDHIRLRGCACVVVAHRLSTIRDCNEIIVLDAGVVVQRGTHEQLIGQPGVYRELIRSAE